MTFFLSGFETLMCDNATPESKFKRSC